jgi:hypothetical protein
VGGEGSRFFSVLRCGVTGSGSGGKASPPFRLCGFARGGLKSAIAMLTPTSISVAAINTLLTISASSSRNKKIAFLNSGS